jgi:hypothetical protein
MLTTSSCQQDLEVAYGNLNSNYVKKPLDLEKFLCVIVKIEGFWLELTTLFNQ